ncbi:MAG: 16S rRNA (adenine(1518)-N(6)/adenine(1519)-N(6))-dimethyltransferase RsmA [Alphaproteobacteria bacterium]|nr:16S rRNA (adenine(1518)-N(6)/adenine(1519)-N(6))-dimethyltransferase RsmA [Alphaproteobacteria bacterium]
MAGRAAAEERLLERLNSLPPLREVIAAHGLAAKKGLGQHFLLDLNLTAKIARSSGDLRGVTVIEIGPGPGGLTRALLGAGAERVIAIERDSRCIAALSPLVEASEDRLHLVEGDALSLDLPGLARQLGTRAGAPVRLIANLPYNVATPLLIRALYDADAYQQMTLMFQREVALRIVAAPNSEDYGRLAVLVQSVARARLDFELSPKAFTPPPGVVSAIVQLCPLSAAIRAELPPLKAIEQVTQQAFGQRRKMLRSSLKGLTTLPELLLTRAEIDGTRRAETLSLAEFHRLTQEFLRLDPPESRTSIR